MMVTLVDGRQVDSASEAHRHECEARAILAMPNKGSRRAYLDGWVEHGERGARAINHKGILQHRGIDEVKRLEATILKLWEARKQQSVA